jgi:protein-S-isoprenylcysteine O-methyltransferase Ste14
VSAPTASSGARLFAWSGAVLFFTSLGYFLVSYETRFGRAPAPGLAAPAVAWNLALFGLFAVHHSLFARMRVRQWVARTVPPGLERSCYVWAASLLFIAVTAAWQPVPGTAWEVRGAAAWALPLLQLVGLALSVASATLLDIRDLTGTSMRGPASIAGGAHAGDRQVEFKTVGPYRWVRHPIYLGWILIVFSVPTMTMTRLVLAAASVAYILAAIPLEERTLRAAAGGAYERYAQQVRWKILPPVF